MTALDQAFIKAYVQQGGVPGPAVVATARPVLLSEALSDRAGPPASSPEARRQAVTEALAGPPRKAPVGLPDAGALEALAIAPAPPADPRASRPPRAPAKDAAAQGPSPAAAPGQTGPRARAKVSVADLEIPRGICCLSAPPPTIPLPVPKPRPASRVRPERPEQPGPPVIPAPQVRIAPEPDAPPAEPVASVTLPAVEPAPPSTSAGTAKGPFRPLLQTDRFAWPAVCCALETKADAAIDRLADAIRAFAARGANLVAVASRRRGEGSTTLLLCAARRLARRGVRLVLVEADLDRPSLAPQLDLAPEAGWEAVAAGRLPLEEVVIESVEDRLALLPWCGAGPRPADIPRAQREAGIAALRVLRKHYDVVLADLGPLAEGGTPETSLWSWSGDAIDGLLLVHNVRATPRAELDEARRRLAAAGVPLVGVAENCV